MKKILLLPGLLISFISFSQVGINTTNPGATLDITAKSTSGTTTNVEGLLIPRVDRQKAQSMAAVPVSTMIYVNSITTGAQTGTAANIDTIGYYYFDGSLWVKFSSSTGSNLNLYNSDGSLTGNRVVTQGNNTLAFKANSVNAFSVNNVLSVDAANSRVGIGTITPSEKLEVNGKVKITDLPTASPNDRAIYVDNNGVLKQSSVSAPVRSLWGVIRFNGDSGTISILNPGSGGWTASYVEKGTVLITANTPFARVPAVIFQQTLSTYSTAPSTNYSASGGFPERQATRDNLGIDAVSRNQFQIWVCDDRGIRSNKSTVDSRAISFLITGS